MKTLFTICCVLLSVIAFGRTAMAEEIPLRNVDGFYKAPVKLNGVVTLDFALDTGAADVSMSDDVVNALLKSGAIASGDIRGSRTYMLADGSQIKCRALVIRTIQLGTMQARDVDGSTCPGKALLLLGQSFFKKLGSVQLDFQRNLMIVKAGAAEVAMAPATAPAPEAPLPAPPTAKPPPVAALPPPATEMCDFDVSRVVNGATSADANTIWSCKVGKEPYYVAPLQIFSDGTGVGYAAGSGKFSWRKTGCRSLAYNFNMGGKSFEATDLYGDIHYGTLTMTFGPSDRSTPQQNAVCVKQEGRVNPQAITQVQVVSPSQIDPSCKLLEKTTMKDDLIAILNVAAQKGASYVAYGEKRGENVALALYQCQVGGGDLTKLAAHAQSMGDVARAQELYEKALATNPNDLDALNGLGVMWSQKGDLAKGQSLLEKALSINPNSDLVLGNLGLLYDAKGDQAKAQEFMEKSLAINPNNTTALDGLGVLYAKKGDLPKAKALLEKALAINPGNGQTLYNLAHVYELQLDKPKAIELYRRFLNSGAAVPVEVMNQVRQHVLELER